MFDVCLRLQLQGSLAALLNSQQPAQGAEESVPAADEYGLVGEEQTVAEKAALKAQLAGLTQVGLRVQGVGKYRCHCHRC